MDSHLYCSLQSLVVPSAPPSPRRPLARPAHWPQSLVHISFTGSEASSPSHRTICSRSCPPWHTPLYRRFLQHVAIFYSTVIFPDSFSVSHPDRPIHARRESDDRICLSVTIFRSRFSSVCLSFHIINVTLFPSRI